MLKSAEATTETLDSATLAAEIFDGGSSCVRAVLEATTGSISPDIYAATSGFSSGIRGSGCLCGAVTGGVMALGLTGNGRDSGELVANFKEVFKTTCCRGLSKDYEWMSTEHQANCRRITVATADLVERILKNV